MASTAIAGLRVTCPDCNRAGALSDELLAQRIGEPLTLRSVRRVLPRLVCSSCRNRDVDVWAEGAGGVQIQAAAEIRDCSDCGARRLLPEIRRHPTVDLCPVCVEAAAREGEERSVRPPPHPTPPDELKTCPRCGSPSIVRENADQGTYFVGCTRFPACRWTRDLPRPKG